MAAKPKKPKTNFTAQVYHPTSIKLPISTYAALKEIAAKEKRPVTRQAEVFIEAGIQANQPEP
jgi:hypothetical protein